MGIAIVVGLKDDDLVADEDDSAAAVLVKGGGRWLCITLVVGSAAAAVVGSLDVLVALAVAAAYNTHARSIRQHRDVCIG